ALADAQYDAAVIDLEKALKQGRGRLDTSTVAIVEHNLQIIDQAISQAREALAADPANTYLSSHLVEARRRKLDLLRRAAGAGGGSGGDGLAAALKGCATSDNEAPSMIAALVFSMMALTATDQTVNVTKGTKLDVNNFAGDVNVKVWDKDAVRVEVNHSDREVVHIKPGERALAIRSRSTRGGPPRSLDYTITVPGWMAIAVNGTYADVTLEGVGGDVAVDTTRGDIKVRGGSGFVSLKS